MFKNLEAELSRRGLSKKELSNLTGIEYKTLLNYMTGNTAINYKSMKLIKKVFPDLTIDYLFESEV